MAIKKPSKLSLSEPDKNKLETAFLKWRANPEDKVLMKKYYVACFETSHRAVNLGKTSDPKVSNIKFNIIPLSGNFRRIVENALGTTKQRGPPRRKSRRKTPANKNESKQKTGMPQVELNKKMTEFLRSKRDPDSSKGGFGGISFSKKFRRLK